MTTRSSSDLLREVEPAGSLPPAIVVTGPTASGKSAFALKIAQRFAGEIINCDSVQLYEGFDIGSAKPSAEAFNEAPHHLYSCVPPSVQVDAGWYAERARECAVEVAARGKLPIFVGGTGLYIRSLICGLDDIPPVTEEARATISVLEQGWLNEGLPRREMSSKLHQYLSEIDSESASRLCPSDYQRVRRAVEVRLSSGRTLASFLHEVRERGVLPPEGCEPGVTRDPCVSGNAKKARRGAKRALIICILPPRETLYRAIDARVDEMWSRGLVTEVKELLRTYGREVVPFRSLGYRHALDYLEGRMTESAALEVMKRDTRRYAKRQYTWWRHEPERFAWTRVTSPSQIRKPFEAQSDEVGASVETSDTTPPLSRMVDVVATFASQPYEFGISFFTDDLVTAG